MWLRSVRSAPRCRDGYQPDAGISDRQLSCPPQLGSLAEQLRSCWHSIPPGTAASSLSVDAHATAAPLRQLCSNEGTVLAVNTLRAQRLTSSAVSAFSSYCLQ